jgi:hypothetical protein
MTTAEQTHLEPLTPAEAKEVAKSDGAHSWRAPRKGSFPRVTVNFDNNTAAALGEELPLFVDLDSEAHGRMTANHIGVFVGTDSMVKWGVVGGPGASILITFRRHPHAGYATVTLDDATAAWLAGALSAAIAKRLAQRS